MGKLNLAAMRTVGFVVLGIILAMSGYSLFYVARHFGVPPLFAVSMSVCFDGVAIYLANGSIQEAKDGQTGAVARFWVFVFVGLSAWLNGLHAVIGHETWLAIPMWASLPLAAAVMYEYLNRKERRKALVRNGRYTPNVLPRVPISYRILFGIKTHYGLKLLAQRHWDSVIADAEAHMPLPRTPRTIRGTAERLPGTPERSVSNTGIVGTTNDGNDGSGTAEQPGNDQGTTGTPNVLAFRPASRRAPERHIRDWARENGWPDLAVRGALPAEIKEAYMAANQETIEETGR